MRVDNNMSLKPSKDLNCPQCNNDTLVLWTIPATDEHRRGIRHYCSNGFCSYIATDWDQEGGLEVQR